MSCRNLKTIVFGSKLTSIGLQAFFECGLEEIRIPESVVELKENIFEACSKLKNVTISKKTMGAMNMDESSLPTFLSTNSAVVFVIED